MSSPARGRASINSDYWLEQRKAGTFLAVGSVNGTDYVTSGAMPWEADNSRFGTGIYAKAQ